MKKFLIVGTKGAITFKDVFPYMKDRKVLLGVNPINVFTNGDEQMKFGNIGWFTTMEHHHYDTLILTKTFNEKDYPKYDNYDAIEVSKVKDIPVDYDGVMGVPITFMDKWDGGGFEVEGLAADKRIDEPWCIMGSPTYVDGKHKQFQGMVFNGKAMYSRILIKKKLQFEVIGLAADYRLETGSWNILGDKCYVKNSRKGIYYSMVLNNKPLYARILIKRIP